MQEKRSLSGLSGGKIFDVIVIGGGATGLGIAWDAITRGYSVLLLEKYDFCKGTSSRSTKLVHGGVRYLAQGKIGLVREALRERFHILHSVHDIAGPMDFVIPVYRRWQVPYYGLGLSLYDVLAGKKGLGHTRILNREKVLQKLPGIRREGLAGGIQYMDGRFDDARMGITLVKNMVARGGMAYNYMPVTGLLKGLSGKVKGVTCTDAFTGKELEIQARAVINATGVFTDDVRKMDDRTLHHTVTPSQGTHIVLDGKFLQSSSALMIPETPDGRVLFAIPWHGKMLVGTTDVPVDTISAEPVASAGEIDFILETAAGYLAEKPSRADVLSVFAGLRPLAVEGKTGRKTGDISREHKITVSGSGLISITGGKWTTYRKMAEDCLNRTILEARLFPRECKTLDISLDAWPVQGNGTYIHPELPYTIADLEFAAENEWCYRLEDLLVRRTRCLMIDVKATLEILPQAADIMQKALGWTDAEKENHIQEFNILAAQYLPGISQK